MNEIQIFENAQFGQIRTAGTSNEPLFCLADVCKVLETQGSVVKNRLNQDGVKKVKVIDSIGRAQDVTFVNEANLYRVIMRSNKPQAEAFQDWVCEEVLPSIRKHGGYIAERQDETPEDLMARALQVANETLKRKEARLRQLEDTNKEQEQQLAAAAPKVEYVDKVLQSVNTYTVQQIAKELDMSACKLYRYLKAEGILFKQSGTWMLSAKYNGRGYTKTRTHYFTHNNGEDGSRSYTVITEKGRKFIHEYIKNHK